MNPSPPGQARTTSSRRLKGFLLVLAVGARMAWRCRLRFIGDGWELKQLRIRGR